MQLTPELIGALVIAFTGLLSGISGIISKRTRDQRDELDQLREDYQHARQQLRLADQWIGEIVRVMDQRGAPIPDPPRGLRTSLPEVQGRHERSS
jgi:hypothetical protein